MFRCRAVTAFITILCALAGMVAAARAADVDPAGATNNVVEFLTFVGSAPLDGADRKRVADETQKQNRSHHADLQDQEAKLRKFLTALPNAQPWERAGYRETLRYRLELLPANDPVRQIVDRTDPVILFDRAHKRLITQGTLTAWQQACDWMAGVLSVPRPAGDFVTAQRAYLRGHYATLPDAKQDVFAHVERNYPVMVMIVDRATPAGRATFIRDARREALDHPDTFGIRVADAMSETYALAVQKQIVEKSITDAGVLNAGLQYNMLYHNMYYHL